MNRGRTTTHRLTSFPVPIVFAARDTRGILYSTVQCIPVKIGGFIKDILRGVRCTKSLRVLLFIDGPPPGPLLYCTQEQYSSLMNPPYVRAWKWSTTIYLCGHDKSKRIFSYKHFSLRTFWNTVSACTSYRINCGVFIASSWWLASTTKLCMSSPSEREVAKDSNAFNSFVVLGHKIIKRKNGKQR